MKVNALGFGSDHRVVQTYTPFGVVTPGGMSEGTRFLRRTALQKDSGPEALSHRHCRAIRSYGKQYPGSMLPPFDIFKRETNEEVLWIKSAESFKAARVAVQELMAASPREYVIFSHRTNNRLIVKPTRPSSRNEKRLIFQIAYDELLMASRTQLLEADGFTAVSVLGNDAAKAALEIPHNYSLFLVGNGADWNVRKQMVDWLKARYPKVPILALNPPYQEQLEPADYNVILNGPEEWLFIVQATAG